MADGPLADGPLADGPLAEGSPSDSVLARRPIPPVPARTPNPIRAAFSSRKAKRRWPNALRVALLTGTIIVVGWLVGDMQAGLFATLGVFTASYGEGRPYRNRAVHLACIAFAIAAVVALGIWASPTLWTTVVVVSAIAAIGTFLCTALTVEAPGVYLIVLVCASGTGLADAHVSPIRVGLLALAGGAAAWSLQMSGALFAPRGPEKNAVADAGEAVAAFVASVGSASEETAQHRAAQALYGAWSVLRTQQPARAKPDATVSRLRAINRELHLIFADTMGLAAGGATPSAGVADRARELAGFAHTPSAYPAPVSEWESTPVGRPRTWAALRAACKPGSRVLAHSARVGVASLIAGTIAATLGVDHVYWAIAAATLILHGDLNWLQTIQKSLQRVVGTLAGLLVAGAILLSYPQGLWLALIVAVLKFLLRLLTIRNYTLSVVFVTAIALTMAYAGQRGFDVSDVLLARALDTAIGCATALAVFAVTARLMDTRRLPDALALTLESVGAVGHRLARGDVTAPDARTARRDLHSRAVSLLPIVDASIAGASNQRRTAEQLWPVVVATERLAYRMLVACWSVESSGAPPPLDSAQADELDAVLADLARAAVTKSAPQAGGAVPEFLTAEVLQLRDSLVWSKPGS
ncbi:FUSC family protein [Antrihabitans sp. YC2-6]|uniref:FUSC family protein n=1 Tax=Antrihabitans sp. YC2-6 TaxID=2799498 RepID=UPI0018F5653D|nr:FUSC family protein [Antrihabitans sp. YC2-6]MBJ8347285.1 FUSC family protein [Antrihabitans sp. YC2-6]